MLNKINPRAIELAKRQGNEEVPSERVQPVAPVQQSSSLISNADFSFLGGADGERIFKEYQARANRDYQTNPVLNKLTFSDNLVKGSNPFAFVLLNQILREEGRWVARPEDLEKCLSDVALDLKDTYGDSALVLRGNGDPNEYLAKQLESQIRQRGNFQYPIMIPLVGLNLKSDSDSPHGLGFELTASAELVYAPQFEHKNNSAKFNNADGKGLPIFDENGSRTLYTGEGGLRRLFRNWDLDLGARYGDLAVSSGGGRVVVCREATRTKK